MTTLPTSLSSPHPSPLTMDELTWEKQADIRKTSTERLKMYLHKAGVDEELVLAMDRPQLLEEWARVVAIGQESEPEETRNTPPRHTTVMTEFDLQKQRLEFEMRKYEEERAEGRRREERERVAREEDRRFKNSLASRTKRFGDVMNNVMWKFPQDTSEIPSYFDHVENLFAMYEVDKDVQAKLLLANLNERAKQLTTRLTREQLDNYEVLKEFLLREFRISSIQLKDRFYTMRKLTDETYTILASRLHNTMTYYLGAVHK